AFKEWAVVCEAVGSGRQSLLLRKGGIAEGRDGFSFRSREFFLFPTWFHEQISRTRLPADTPLPPEPEQEIEIRYAVQVEWSGLIRDWQKIRALEHLHVLAEAVVRERFEYEGSPGIHAAFIRAFRLEPPARLRLEPRYGGCRSWVEIPDLADCALVSVLNDEEHERRSKMLAQVLGL
ncbi:MAG: DUF1802 family protein, partial [Terrimicrobiaceae bacterium]|nr:DUF1802 family protein [Terrimicrobiaceae bacterium]